jgi:hypothetical protein
VRWDSAYYANIALVGYSHQIIPRWAFFPGYPILIAITGRILTSITSLNTVQAVYFAGFLVSNAAFFGAMYYLAELSRSVLKSGRLAFRSATLLAFYPAGVFLSAVYSDSLFLLLTFASLFYLSKNNLGKTTLLGFLSSLTRPVGIALVVPVLYKSARGSSWRMAGPTLGIVSGYLSFLIYGQIMAGTVFASSIAERAYWSFMFTPYARLGSDVETILAKPIILPFLVLSFVAMVAFIQVVRSCDETEIGLYSICLLAGYLASPLDSFPRYSIALIPIYWSLSRWLERSVVGVLIYPLFLVLLAIGTALFANWWGFY